MIDGFILRIYTPGGAMVSEEEFLISPDDEDIKDRLRLYGEDYYAVVIEKRVRLLPFA